ncbi:hypothetical protein G6F43_013063 [Rhizopus delemar]|nr:hypothetical protein G6F43_013063 [Rhizopus delemar]
MDGKSFIDPGGGGLMLGGCITSEEPGYACQIDNGTMNSEVYQEILGTSLQDTMEYYGLNWETSDSGMIYLDDWPLQSPDLIPIEHVWHHLKLKLSMYDNKTASIHELRQRVENEWNSFTKEQCIKYIDSMPDRIQVVLAEKGGFTKY